MKLGCDKQTVILGPPGCGKTSALLKAVEHSLDSGIDPEDIAFVSFTRKAIVEAVTRASDKFGFDRNRMRYFKTIHALCYQQLGLSKDQVMAKVNYQAIGESLGINFTGMRDDDGSGLPNGGTLGDKMLFLYELARVKRIDMQQAYHDYAVDRTFTWHHFKQFVATINDYRERTGMMDFTEMLEQFVKRGDIINARVAIVDEAQDLSSLQWEVLKTAFSNVETVYIAGDDDQCIYSWSGADKQAFLELEGTHVVLTKSFRLPIAVHQFASSIIAPVTERFVKKFIPRKVQGSVDWLSHLDQLDLSTEGSWLLLARNVFQIPELEQRVKDQGNTYVTRGGHPSIKRASTRAIVTWEHLRKGQTCSGDDIQATYDYLKVGSGVKRGFKGLSKIDLEAQYGMKELREQWGLLRDDPWHEALEGIPDEERQYYLTVLRRGGTKLLRDPPRIHINTIHGVKGGEADNVLLLTDMARRTYDQYQHTPDDERRVFYVGATRAKNALHVVMPMTSQFFTF